MHPVYLAPNHAPHLERRYEPSRLAGQHLSTAYERAVPLIRRPCADGSAAWPGRAAPARQFAFDPCACGG